MSNLEPHPSLPARPPPSAYAAPPRHGSNNQNSRAYPNASTAFGGFTPRSVVARAPATQFSAAPAYAPMMMTSQAPYNVGGYATSPVMPNNGYYQQQHPGYGYATSTPPMMANPYPAPGAGRGFGRPGAYDAEEEARLAEWNSAYTQKDDANKKGNANATSLGVRSGDAVASPVPEGGAGGNGANKGKQKTVLRQGGGKSWEDPSLLEWDPQHPRLFVGNLAGEVTDDSLLKAFSIYLSVSKARVIRDKKSTKSKSYGFVSFSNTDDYFRAAKEMEGKYIGSHPVRIKRANTEIIATTKREDKQGRKGKNNKKNAGPGAVISGAPTYNNVSGGGVQKSTRKNKGGPRILG